MIMKKPLVSIITVNYNQPQYTAQLLSSLKNISYSDWEVVVVDNGCSPKGLSKLSDNYPNLQYVRSDTNLGFAGGNNLGIKKSQGEYVLLLNNDTEVDPGFLEPMVDLMESNSAIGIVSPMLIYQESGKVQYAGAQAINPITGRGKKLGHLDEPEQHVLCYPTELAHGAALLFRRELLTKIGYLFEGFFLYYEEHDWTEQAKNVGYQVYFQGNSQVYHKESASVGKMSSLKTYYMNRSRILYLLRNTSGLARFSSLSVYFFIALPKKAIKHLLKAEFAHLRALFSATRIIFSNKHEYATTKSKPIPC